MEIEKNKITKKWKKEGKKCQSTWQMQKDNVRKESSNKAVKCTGR